MTLFLFNLYFPIILIVYSFNSMSCRQCSDRLGNLFHNRCRSHPECSRGIQYYGRPCPICQDLWRRARDLDHPEDAILAFKILREWIQSRLHNHGWAFGFIYSCVFVFGNKNVKKNLDISKVLCEYFPCVIQFWFYSLHNGAAHWKGVLLGPLVLHLQLPR